MSQEEGLRTRELERELGKEEEGGEELQESKQQNLANDVPLPPSLGTTSRRLSSHTTVFVVNFLFDMKSSLLRGTHTRRHLKPIRYRNSNLELNTGFGKTVVRDSHYVQEVIESNVMHKQREGIVKG